MVSRPLGSCCLLLVQLVLVASNLPAIAASEGHTRKITATLNPGCPDTLCRSTGAQKPDLISVVHVRAEGPVDCIHQVWDFTGKPTVLVARTGHNASLQLDWSEFMDDQPRSVGFDETPMYSTALVLGRLLYYNDSNDTGHLLSAAGKNITSTSTSNSAQPIIAAYDLRNATWRRHQFSHSAAHAELQVDGTSRDWFGRNTTAAIRLRFSAFGRRQYDPESPHMLHSENGTQIALILDHLSPLVSAGGSGNGTASPVATGRFALELVHMASEQRQPEAGAFRVQRRRSLDDEHTPGVFDLVDVMSPLALAHSNGSFMHFRPVSYTNAERDMGSSTDVHVAEPANVTADAALPLVDGSLAWSYYGHEAGRQLLQAYNVSLGRTEDGYYAKSGYATWTFEMGYGAPPEEQMSLFVVIVASVGLVLPVILLLSGGLYICGKRLRDRRLRQGEDDFY